jgi:alpha-amylase
VGQGYAYILTHPGVPCLFWEHYFEWGHEMQNTIDTLLQVGGGLTWVLWMG